MQSTNSLKCFTMKTSLGDYYSWNPTVDMLISNVSPLFLCLGYKHLVVMVMHNFNFSPQNAEVGGA